MRGGDQSQSAMFSYVSPEARIPSDHPLRPVRVMVDEALRDLNRHFNRVYAKTGRPSIAPERLIRALVLQIFYSIRSERMLMEQLDYNLLFRWFVGLSMDDPVWDHSTFSKNRSRLFDEDFAQRFFDAVLVQAKAAGLTSDEHFSVDGTLIEAWASHKSVRRKDGSDDDNPDGLGRNAGRNFHGEQRSNETHASTTDPDARLARKGDAQASKLAYAGHIVTENRNALVVDAALTQANGTAERDAGVTMLERIDKRPRSSVGADKGYDTHGFVKEVRELGYVPHVAQNLKRRGGSAIDARTTRHGSYRLSQIIRKRIEEAFAWGKQIGPIRKTKLRGRGKVGFQFVLTMACYNLVRMRTLLGGRFA